MSVIARCEVCEKPIPDGQEIVHPDEGDSYCARCCVDLIGAERDDLARQLRGAVEALAQIERVYERTMPGPIDALRERVLEIIGRYRTASGGQ